MRTVLVTGGAGFVGSAFVHHLTSCTDVDVIVLDNLSYAGDRASLKGADCELVEGDITNPKVVDDLVRRCDAVVHFAAESHNDNSLMHPAAFVSTNILGTFTILEAVRRHDVRYHHVSTDEVFGDLPLGSKGKKFSETSPYDPSSPYSATKASSDLLVRAWIRSFDLPATVSNCSNNYGPRQHVEKFIPRQITELIDGRRPKLYGDGRNIRDWIHVDDHSEAVLAILRSAVVGRTYVIGADQERSNREIVNVLLQIFDRPPDDVEHVRDRPGHDRRYALDAHRIRVELDWMPKVSDIRSGLIETVRWYRENEWWWRSKKSEVELAYARLGH